MTSHLRASTLRVRRSSHRRCLHLPPDLRAQLVVQVRRRLGPASSSTAVAPIVVPAAASSSSTASVAAVATVAPQAAAANAERPCQTVRQSNQELQKLRHRCHNTMHLSAMVLANGYSCQVMDALAKVCLPMNTAFNFMRTMFKSAASSLIWKQGMTLGTIDQELADTWATLSSPSTVDWVGFAPADEAKYV